MFYLANLPICAQPGSQIGQPSYGVITSTRINSPQIQLELKREHGRGSVCTRDVAR